MAQLLHNRREGSAQVGPACVAVSQCPKQASPLLTDISAGCFAAATAAA